MKLLGYFDVFLPDVVNLNQTRLTLLDDRVEAIVGWLDKDTVIGPLLQRHVPQGSWAHKTIIRPVEGREFDADFLLTLTEVEEWSATPKVYLQQVRAAFKRSWTYAEMVRRKNRCVRIGYSGDCHVDVVPHLILAGGRQVIINYAEDKFEDTNPEGFTAWMTEKNGLANGNLRKVIRLLKYVRDFKETFSVPSVILTMLLGERVQAFDEATRYADVPTTLMNLMTDLDAWLKLYPDMPVLEDPSCPGTTFNHRWNQDRYENFRKWVTFYADRITEAYQRAGQGHQPRRLAENLRAGLHPAGYQKRGGHSTGTCGTNPPHRPGAARRIHRGKRLRTRRWVQAARRVHGGQKAGLPGRHTAPGNALGRQGPEP